MKCIICNKKEKIKGSSYCSQCKYKKEIERDKIGLAYRRLKAHAKFRGKEFTLTKQQFEEFCVKSEYLNKSGIYRDSYHVDRIDESKGYTATNIQLLTNSDNVKKYCKWIYRNENGSNIFKTEVTGHANNNFSDVPF